MAAKTNNPTPEAMSKAEAALWLAYQEDRCDRTRNALVEHYLSWADGLCHRRKRLLPNHVRIEDLLAYGRLGLIRAIERFAPARHVPFKSYAAIRVRGAMEDGIRDMAFKSRAAARHTSWSLLSLDAPIQSREDQSTLSKEIGMEDATQHTRMETQEQIEQVLGELSDRARIIYEYYHKHQWTQHRIAQALGVAPATISLALTAAQKRIAAIVSRHHLSLT